MVTVEAPEGITTVSQPRYLPEPSDAQTLPSTLPLKLAPRLFIATVIFISLPADGIVGVILTPVIDGVGVGVAVDVGVGVGVGVAVDVGVGVGVGVAVDVGVGVGVGVDVDVGVGVDVAVDVGVGVGVGVAVDVGVGVDVAVDVGVGVDVAVDVGVGVGVDVAVDVGVGVDVAVDVGVGVGVDVAVDVGVGVGVGVGDDIPKYSDIVTTSNCPSSSLLFKKSLIVLKSEILYSSGTFFPTTQHPLSSSIMWNVIINSPFCAIVLFISFVIFKTEVAGLPYPGTPATVNVGS